jgi:hypothetical protein
MGSIPPAGSSSTVVFSALIGLVDGKVVVGLIEGEVGIGMRF